MTFTTPATRRLFGGGLAALAVAAGLLGAAQDPEDQEPTTREAILETRSLIEEWSENDRLISKERLAWAATRQGQLDRIELYKQELEELQAAIAETEANTDKIDSEVGELVDREAELTAATATLDEVIVELEKRVKRLVGQLPDPLQEQLANVSQGLPEDPTETKLTLRVRFGTVLALLDQINKFNRDIHVFSELRDLGGGSSAEVASIYIGLGQAYYVSPDGAHAGIGKPGPNGWVWTREPDKAEDIQLAIDVFNNSSPAQFVRLPLLLTDLGAEAAAESESTAPTEQPETAEQETEQEAGQEAGQETEEEGQ